MSEKKNKNTDKSSKTDSLIEEAIQGVYHLRDDEEEFEFEGKDENISREDEEDSQIGKDTAERRREAVAKIDLQQYVEKETYMRLAADFDNFRRRALKERQEWERQGKERVMRELLDVMDNFSRGLQQATEDKSPLAEGMRMVFSQMESILKNDGLEKIKTAGEKFNPNLHDAVSSVVKEGYEESAIVEELKCGYKWGDRLLRPASVVVAKASE